MKILYIHQYFKTPEEGGAIRSYYIAKGFVENNWEVELISAHNELKYKIKNVDGIKVHYLPVEYANHFGYFSRSLAFLSFSFRALILAFKLKGVDVCYATSTPLTVGIVAILLKKFKGIPYIFEVRDLWPEAPIQLKVVRNKLLKTILYWLEFKIYKNSKSIIALSPGIQEYIKRKNPEKPVYMIPNMADLNFFKEAISVGNQKVDKKSFTIIYLGATGRVNRIYSILQMAREAKELELDILFQVVGAGSEYQNLKKEAKIQSLFNIIFHEFKSKSDLRKLLKDADASYISYENLPVLETSSPNKFFDSLAAGKLIIINIKGWLHDITLTNKCGIYVDPDKRGDFALKIGSFLKDEKLLKAYQLNAQKLAEENFLKEKQLQKLISILKDN